MPEVFKPTKIHLRKMALLGIIAAIGWPASAQDVPHVVYEYDELGRLVETAYLSGALREFTYDAAGNRKSVATSLNNDTSTWVAPGEGPTPPGKLIVVHTLTGPIFLPVAP